MRTTALTALALLSLAAFGGVAAAQDSASKQEEIKQSAATTLVDFEKVMTDAACDPKAIQDPRFVADAKNAIRPLIHAEDARAMLTNKKHVVMAYAAILILLVGFVVLLYMRQSKLSREIEQLRASLEDQL